jgi:hypothetical protein
MVLWNTREYGRGMARGQVWRQEHVPDETWQASRQDPTLKPLTIHQDQTCLSRLWLLKIRSLPSAVAVANAHDLIRFLVHEQVSKDKWPSILGRGLWRGLWRGLCRGCLCTSLCSAVVNGKSCHLAMSSDDTWHASASRDETWHTQHLHAPQRARGSI